MSHQPERKEKDCLNCGTILNGRYCHVCGQENIQIHQNFASLTRHFIYDIFHFDGKFWDTLKYLVSRPGYIPKQYIQGKRQSYLDPIRMYLFTSAIFFIVFFAVKDPGMAFTDVSSDIALSHTERFVMVSDIHNNQSTVTDSITQKKLEILLDTAYTVYLVPIDSAKSKEVIVERDGKLYGFTRVRNSASFRGDSTGNWVSRTLTGKLNDYKRKFGDDISAMLSDFSNIFMHRLPYVLFISLPLFALILKMLYIRRKGIQYADHVVFTLYHYILTFIILLLFFGVEALFDKINLRFFDTLVLVFMLSIFTFLFLSMKRFYGQGFGKTLVKFIVLNFLAVLTLLFLIVIFILFSIFQL